MKNSWVKLKWFIKNPAAGLLRQSRSWSTKAPSDHHTITIMFDRDHDFPFIERSLSFYTRSNESHNLQNVHLLICQFTDYFSKDTADHQDDF